MLVSGRVQKTSRDIPWIRLFYDLIELQATRPQQVLEPQPGLVIFSKIKCSTCKRTMFQNGVCLCVCVCVCVCVLFEFFSGCMGSFIDIYIYIHIITYIYIYTYISKLSF